MEKTLKSRHIAPTAPDQLGCYPFYDQGTLMHNFKLRCTDPFVLERCPHVYFIGNQKQFATKLIHGTSQEIFTYFVGPRGEVTRLISLPAFADNPLVVLVNLKDLNVHPLAFNVNIQ